ncbi:superoxide dismutase [Phakopsora pachyrhizi]|uniref:Superoxide dismutase n=1 Tax=Phakopsora pachyrhizi TaxID=170000 RepID=A0AAV0B9N1_PHAPC|nr:superoxide dismutase [Phakopsora pachyrhizi]
MSRTFQKDICFNLLKKISLIVFSSILLTTVSGVGGMSDGSTVATHPHPGGSNEGPDDKSCSGGNAHTARASIKGHGGIHGVVRFDLIHGGLEPTLIQVNVSGLPAGSTYAYHVHEHRVDNGNCSTALGHFNPTNVPMTATCDFYKPSTCMAGDLAGMFGNLQGGVNNEIRYYTPFLKFSPREQSFVGKSVVIHSPDTKRIACGKFCLYKKRKISLTKPSF